MNRGALAAILILQIVSAAFFVGERVMSFLGYGPIDWNLYELIEVGAALGLVSGVVMGFLALRAAHRRSAKAEAALRQARSAFRDVLDDRFDGWELTPAERDVALFSIKGFSTQDIANLRGVSEGTVKAQSNAIYRKAGVSSRAQLLSLFIDELVEDP